MKRPENQEIFALAHVSENTVFMQWLRDCRDLIYNKMEVTNDSNELHALRGEARAIGDLLQTLKDSHAASRRG